MSKDIINGLVNIKVRTINITNNCNTKLIIDTLCDSH